MEHSDWSLGNDGGMGGMADEMSGVVEFIRCFFSGSRVEVGRAALC